MGVHRPKSPEQLERDRASKRASIARRRAREKAARLQSAVESNVESAPSLNVIQFPKQPNAPISHSEKMKQLDELCLNELVKCVIGEKGIAKITAIKALREITSKAVISEHETLEISFTSHGEQSDMPEVATA